MQQCCLSLFGRIFNENFRLTNNRTEMKFKKKRGMLKRGGGWGFGGGTNSALGDKEMKLLVSVEIREINIFL